MGAAVRCVRLQGVGVCTEHRPISRYRDLRADGLSRRDIARAVGDGSLRPVRIGWYARPRACDPRVEAVRLGGELACVSAARHEGLWTLEPDGATHIAMPRHGQRPTGTDVVAHWQDGAPGLVRTLLEVHRCRGTESFFVVLESALRQRRLSPRDLDALRGGLPRAGRRAMDLARSDADSGLESLLRWRLRHHGVRVRTQWSVPGVGRVDLLLGDRLLVEADGVDNHGSTAHRHRDLTRDATAAIWGLVTLRFDYALIVHDWDLVERAILAHLDLLAGADVHGIG